MRSRSTALAAILLLVACGTPVPAIRSSLRVAEPSSAGASPPAFVDRARRAKLASAYPKLDAYFAALHASQKLPGLAVGLVIDGDLAWSAGYGVTDLDTQTAVDVDTLFEIGSLTKPFTALALLRLRDEGRVSFDVPAATYLAELADVLYPASDAAPITLRHLLTHTAGLPNIGPALASDGVASEAELVGALRHVRLRSAPGTTDEYSSLGIALAGVIVARVSGTPYRDFLRERVLRPLGMTATDWWDAGHPIDRRASGYEIGESDRRIRTPPWVAGANAPAGGLYSSVREMARYLAFQLDAWPSRDGADRGPVRRSSRREMQTIQWLNGIAGPSGGASSKAVGTGLGGGAQYRCGVGPMFSMSGGGNGYASMLAGFPEEGVAMVVLMNEFDPSLSMYSALRWDDVIAILRETGGFEPRITRPNPALTSVREHLTKLLFERYDDNEAARLLAVPFEPRGPVPWGTRPAGLANVRRSFGACAFERDLPPKDAMEAHWLIGLRAWESRAVGERRADRTARSRRLRMGNSPRRSLCAIRCGAADSGADPCAHACLGRPYVRRVASLRDRCGGSADPLRGDAGPLWHMRARRWRVERSATRLHTRVRARRGLASPPVER
jgi:CubicO group peptidase (beta-lactamase class C family)